MIIDLAKWGSKGRRELATTAPDAAQTIEATIGSSQVEETVSGV
jgi:hypothetical protein